MKYVDIIKFSKNPSFIMVSQKDCSIKNFESVLQDCVNLPKNFMISKTVKIAYFPDGTISVFREYDGQKEEFRVTESSICNSETASEAVNYNDLMKAPLAPQVGIKYAKFKDVQALKRYLSEEGRKFFDNFFESITIIEKPSKHVESTTQSSKSRKKSVQLTEPAKSKKKKRSGKSTKKPAKKTTK